MSKESVITLFAPIVAGEETIAQITLRRPTGKDVRELGYPYKLGADQAVTIQAGIVAAFISRLADIPPSYVDRLDPVDFNTLGFEVIGFFLNTDAAAPSS